MIWLRAQGSTVVSQFIDTLIVIYLAFYVLPALAGDPHMSAGDAARVATTNYIYKFAIAVLLTPLLYGVRALVVSWIGSAEQNVWRTALTRLIRISARSRTQAARRARASRKPTSLPAASSHSTRRAARKLRTKVSCGTLRKASCARWHASKW